MAARSPYTGEKLVEGVNADRRGGKLRARDPYEGMYNAANKALTDYATSLQADQPTMESDIQAGAETQRRTIKQQKEAGLGNIGMQRQRATTASESAIAEARRVASEQMQGLQARYGTATGTGGFTGELLGRETARNIAGERTGLAQTMETMDLAERDLISQADNQIFQIDTQANQAVNESRRQLRDQLAQINMKKGELEADKAARRIQALQNYQLTLRQIEADREKMKVQMENEKQMKLLDFELQKKMLAEKARYDGTGITSLSDMIKTTSSYNDLTGNTGLPVGMGLNQYYNMIKSGQPILSSYFEGQGSSTAGTRTQDLGTKKGVGSTGWWSGQ